MIRVPIRQTGRSSGSVIRANKLVPQTSRGRASVHTAMAATAPVNAPEARRSEVHADQDS
jgi:hypothetical protein